LAFLFLRNVTRYEFFSHVYIFRHFRHKGVMGMDDITLNWEIIGARFINAGDNIQALFLKGIAKELVHWKSDYEKELQAFSIANKLSDVEQEQLKIFFSCLWFKEAQVK